MIFSQKYIGLQHCDSDSFVAQNLEKQQFFSIKFNHAINILFKEGGLLVYSKRCRIMIFKLFLLVFMTKFNLSNGRCHPFILHCREQIAICDGDTMQQPSTV